MRHGFACYKGCASALLCGYLFFPSIEAYADNSASELAYLQDLPVVLGPSRLSQPLSDAPNATTVIDRQMIKASGFRTIADLFRLVPGMYVGNAGANAPFVSLNGVSDQYSHRMQVLVDGRSVYLPPFGGVDWQDLPLMIDDIERIEVVRGPAAASHGSNSFYGVINIITRDAGSMNGKSISANKGTMGISDVSARLGKAGQDVDYRLSFGYRADGGDNPQIVNDTSVNRLFNLRTNYRPDSENSIDIQLGLNQGVYGMGTLGRPEDAFRDAATANDFQQLTWLHTWYDRDESKLTYYRINRAYTDPYKCIDFLMCKGYTASPVSQGFAPDMAKIQRQELELQNTTQIGSSNRAVWGGSVRYDYVDQPLLFNTAEALLQSSVFAHDEWRMTDATLMNMGAMYEDDGAGHRSISPRVALNYHVLPQHTLRASVSTATRNPMMAELYMNTPAGGYWPNAYVPPANNLQPEKILSRELGYVGQFGDLSVDGRVYYDKVRDIIMLDAYVNGNLANRTDSFKNLFDATFKGLDISAKYRWQEGDVIVNYSHQQTSCAFSSYPTQYFNPTPISATMTAGQYLAQAYQTDYLNLCSQSVPENSGSLLLDQRLPDSFRFSIGYYLRSQVRVTDVSSGYPPESPMHRVDLRIAKAFGQEEKPGGGEVAVVIQNAFQDNYTGYGNVPQRVNLLFNRRAYFTATYNF
ncbi:colicin I receptor precursor [mine drainage metagenome]|uniref:Colicin I receptor n=1 Tax=mine drainage metagenome TaxID=410659 RepID=A0A1J5TGD0_9ZZZZ